MMISSKESCGTDIPNTSGTRRNTMFSRGFYNPPYQISGQHYMAGTIATVGPAPMDVGELAYVAFIAKMNIRESPSVDGPKTGKTTEINKVYNIKAKSWDSVVTVANSKIGDTQRLWYLITTLEDPSTPLGWACAIEGIKTEEPETFEKIYYAVPDKSDDDAVLTPEQLKQWQSDKKVATAKVNKWKAAHAPKVSPSGGKDKPAAAKTGAEDTGGGGLSTTSMVLIGLGAAALVYFLIQKGKK